jgi:N-acyl-D-aspartate/D-glutamate deacylase
VGLAELRIVHRSGDYPRKRNRPRRQAATPAQLDQMRELVQGEMESGALGITTALIYPPAFYEQKNSFTGY